MTTASVQDTTSTFHGCEREPIHIPGSIQPHGSLLVLDADSRRVSHAAANAGEVFGRGLDQILGRTVESLFDAAAWDAIRPGLGDPSIEANPRALGLVNLAGVAWRIVAHRLRGLAIIEIIPDDAEAGLDTASPDPLLRAYLARLPSAVDATDIARIASEEVRRRTGFDRALVYRFDVDDHGTVIAEDRNERLQSYLGLRFPASDIPAQARQLYTTQKLRLIADVDYVPVPIVAAPGYETSGPIDLSYAMLRSVSPVHVQYMKNMGTGSSMSISIVRGGRLWGLVSVHHHERKSVPYAARSACELLGQMLSAYLELKEHNEEYAERMRLKSLESRLLQFMAEEEFFLDGLRRHGAELLAFAGASGAAVVVDATATLIGNTPDEHSVLEIAEWLASLEGSDLFATDSLPSVWPEAERFGNDVVGLMAVAVSRLHRSYLMWFRPEVVRTVEWAGDPSKPEEMGTLRPRASFEIWKETVRGKSEPWSEAHRTAATELRAAIVDIVLRKAEELAEKSEELVRSNKELEAFSYSVSHDLRAPLRHVVGFSELLRDELGRVATPNATRFLDTIADSARFAGTLVDNLLKFSQVGRTRVIPVTVDLNVLVDEVHNEVMSEAVGREVAWSIGPLPTVRGDLIMLRLAIRNLLSNALKFTKTRPVAEIGVTCATRDGQHVLTVADNGVGFDMAYSDKLFGVFQRLHRMEDFEGTGIGLANVRRIAERHGGHAWAEGAVDRGAKFFFSLPQERR